MSLIAAHSEKCCADSSYCSNCAQVVAQIQGWKSYISLKLSLMSSNSVCVCVCVCVCVQVYHIVKDILDHSLVANLYVDQWPEYTTIITQEFRPRLSEVRIFL